MPADNTTYLHSAIAAPNQRLMNTGWVSVCVIAVTIMLVWGSIGLHLITERDAVLRDAEHSSGNFAYGAAQGVGGMMVRIDHMLLAARSAYASGQPLPDPAKLLPDAPTADPNGTPPRAGNQSSELLIDRLAHTSGDFPLADGADPLLVSDPVKRDGSDAPMLRFSRAIAGADGAPAGFVVLWVDPRRLTQAYETLETGRAVMALVTTDGRMRARGSSSVTDLGQRLPGWQSIVSQAVGRGAYRRVSPLDGVDRIASVRPVYGYNLVVLFGIDADQAFAGFCQDRLICLAAGAVLTLFILLTGSVIVRQNNRLARSRQVLLSAVENISQGLIVIDENRRMPLINGRAIDLLAISPEILARDPSFDELIAWQMGIDEPARGEGDAEQLAHWISSSRLAVEHSCYERTRPDGRVLEVNTRVLPNGGAVRTFTDISARKATEARIRHMAYHDGLTGLANRALLSDRLQQSLNHATRNGGALAVLAVDLDGFKRINDHFGHDTGDNLLKQVGARLQGALRAADTLARVGGDEFVVIQTDVDQPLSAADLARRLTAAVSLPYMIEGHQVRIGAGIGAAVYPADGETAATLLKAADTALTRAKATGLGSFCFFEAKMDLALQERRALEDDLRLAIGTEALRLHFQPVFACATGEVTGFEALIRWQHPKRGNISPLVFIPIAEQTGMIVPIGAWVLEEACRTAALWDQPKRIAVNLSCAELRAGDLAMRVADVLCRTGLAATRLELEITESLLIDDPAEALATLRALRDLGVRIACDDFGTGYSSFSYLQNLAFDRLKIDKSFVDGIETNPNALRIIQAMLVMAHSLGLEVTAEGIETERQRVVLREQGCDEIQGFLMSRPIPSDAVDGFLRGLTSEQADLVSIPFVY